MRIAIRKNQHNIIQLNSTQRAQNPESQNEKKGGERGEKREREREK